MKFKIKVLDPTLFPCKPDGSYPEIGEVLEVEINASSYVYLDFKPEDMAAVNWGLYPSGFQLAEEENPKYEAPTMLQTTPEGSQIKNLVGDNVKTVSLNIEYKD